MSKEADNWTGCYEGGWNGLIVPEAFSHPAKFSYKLTERMFGHAIRKGWISKGSVVVDPFGGVGCGGIVAAYNDVQWIGCELEETFVALAGENFELHRPKWEGLGCPQPVILQGDSREMCETIQKALDSRNSPHYTNEHEKDKDEVDSGSDARTLYVAGRDSGTSGSSLDDSSASVQGGKLGDPKLFTGSEERIQGKPPSENRGTREESLQLQTRQEQCSVPDDNRQGQVPGVRSDGEAGDSPQERRPLRQSGGESGSSLPVLPHEHNEKEVVGSEESRTANAKEQRADGMAADLIISSPPFQESSLHGIDTNPARMMGGPCAATSHGGGKATYHNPISPGNLGNLKPGDVAAVVSSPPYEGSVSQGVGANDAKARKDRKAGCGIDITRSENLGGPNSVLNTDQQYGDTQGNIGNQTGPTFWQAAKEIVQQCHQILMPGGHAIWVVKAFVRKGKIVDFPGDWRRLCESVGFKTVCTHHAMLVKETTEDGLFGEITEKSERKSLFRRLAESKGSPAIDYEVVLCMEK